MTKPCILAVDPGLSGALAFYFPTVDAITAEDMPVAGGDIDAATLAARIAQMKPDIAIVELVASRPGQGVASVFKFGCGFGMVRGVIATSSVPLHLVTPAKWKRHFGLDFGQRESAGVGASVLAGPCRPLFPKERSRAQRSRAARALRL